jgi:hypothetical protein
MNTLEDVIESMQRQIDRMSKMDKNIRYESVKKGDGATKTMPAAESEESKLKVWKGSVVFSHQMPHAYKRCIIRYGSDVK